MSYGNFTVKGAPYTWQWLSIAHIISCRSISPIIESMYRWSISRRDHKFFGFDLVSRRLLLIYLKRMFTCCFPVSGAWKTEEVSSQHLFYFAFKIISMMMEDPRTAIGGIIPIMDLTGFNSSHIKTMSDSKISKTMTRFMQASFKNKMFT